MNVYGLTPVQFGLAFALTTLSSTDLLPSFIREAYFDPYKLKAVPMILAWALIHAQLLFYRRADEGEPAAGQLEPQAQGRPSTA